MKPSSVVLRVVMLGSLLLGTAGVAYLGGAIPFPVSVKGVKPPVKVEEAVRLVVGTLQTQPNSSPSAMDELVITKARYGAPGRWVDVTELMQQQVHGGQLSARSGNALAGDPAYGRPKVLEVKYLLAGAPAVWRVVEGQELRLPTRPQEHELWRQIQTQEQMVQLAKLCPGQVAFFARNLTTGKTLEYRPDRPYCLASIVKLFVLSEAMRQEALGELTVQEKITLQRQAKTEEMMIDQALDLMIGQSDNDATNALAKRVSYNRVNLLVRELDLKGFAPEVLPHPGTLEKALDRRIKGRPEAEPPLDEPQHGTARGLVEFFHLLHEDQVVNATVSERIRQVLKRNSMSYAQRTTPLDGACLGKGGSLLWMRPLRREYNMCGWGIWVQADRGRPGVAVGILCEWWPAGMPDEQEYAWLAMITDCLVNTLADE